MKILIVGSDLNAFLIAEYIKTQSNRHDLYITTDIKSENNTYTPVKIKENEVEAICDFVKYNQIEFTLVTSPLAIINEIADKFDKEGFLISAPYSEAARVTFFNSIAKKVMYKLKINTPRFGIFNRENIAVDYIRHAKFPIKIMNDFTVNGKKCDVYKSYSKARLALSQIFENENEKIVIENYLDFPSFYIYFLTDGYNALPLISVERKEGDSFEEIIAPGKKISENLLNSILKKAVYPLLDDIVKYAGNYSGILGLKILLKDNNFYILEYYNGFQSYDLQAFLSLLDEDFIQLFCSVTKNNGRKYNAVKLKNKSSYTLAVKKSEISGNNDEGDYFITEDDKNIIFTATASTLNFAKKNLKDYLETVCNKWMYEKIADTTKEELKI